MLRRVVATQFDRPSRSGKTRPLFLTCTDPDGAEVEIVAKLSAGCEQQAVSLARELIAACLAGDLGLPVPEPVLVELRPAWIESVSDGDVHRLLRASLPVAFGSRHVGNQFSTWKPAARLTERMVPVALAIFVFDAVIANPDRRTENPNCLVKGEEIRIIDHEMALTHHLVVPRLTPWRPGALQNLMSPGRHIFRDKLRGRLLDFSPVLAAWANLSDSIVEGYATVVSAEWASAAADAAAAVQTIKDVRDHMEECLVEIRRVLA
jgi:hypothetical protein